MNENQKRGIVSLFGALGVIILLFGIFLDRIDFGLAFMGAVTFWFLAGAVENFLGLDEDDNLTTSESIKKGIVNLIAMFGVLILLAGIFIENVNFMSALFLAIVIFILNGVLSSFLGVDEESKAPKRRHRYVPTAQMSQPTQYSQSQPISSPHFSQTAMSDIGPAKTLCNNCGDSLGLEDLFCANCGHAQS
ncbi:MAG: zinc ribbon domain-containing protein [Candidatus Hodarchaeales archaeon]|jgi:hypothetical protein